MEAEFCLKGIEQTSRAPSKTTEMLEDHRLPAVPSGSQSPFQFPGIKYFVNMKSGLSRWLAKAYEQLHLSKEGFSNHRHRGVLWHWGKFQAIFEVVFLKLVYQKNFSMIHLNMC